MLIDLKPSRKLDNVIFVHKPCENKTCDRYGKWKVVGTRKSKCVLIAPKGSEDCVHCCHFVRPDLFHESEL